ncbi:LytR C-terminal domain-containing protein [Streptomyces albidus (ex Kaewkla and Franco 2022)]|uniref:LytR C-terminal domain-containing protein n=1 Tax=Streptomyces albidus (ex Kaewkla and Franco 2022) TaxID=722709 RepID=UPI001F2BECAF|nr:LytR C-terminal domain-containing protein [Streptomyces albidus (ex Kaewkla and Franco 2022)]
MSMLTPPGMGGKYRITGNRYPRMRRPRNRRRIVLASIASVCALGVAGWGTLQLIDIFSGGTPARASSNHAQSKNCGKDAKARGSEKNEQRVAGSGKPVKLPEPDTIKVNVLNSTDRSGLAKTTADALKERGFKIGKVANAPKEFDKKVKNVGLLLGAPGEDGDARLKVLGTQLKDTDTRFDERKGDDVDFVIGDDYKKLAKEKDADAAMAALANPSPSASKSTCTD